MAELSRMTEGHLVRVPSSTRPANQACFYVVGSCFCEHGRKCALLRDFCRINLRLPQLLSSRQIDLIEDQSFKKRGRLSLRRTNILAG